MATVQEIEPQIQEAQEAAVDTIFKHEPVVQQGKAMLEVSGVRELVLTLEEEEVPALLEVIVPELIQEMEVQGCSLVMVIITQAVAEQVLGQQAPLEMGQSVVVVVAMPIAATAAAWAQGVVLLEIAAAMVRRYQTTVLSLPEALVELIQEAEAVVRTNLVIAVIEEGVVTEVQV
jgi:hypothetical protein